MFNQRFPGIISQFGIWEGEISENQLMDQYMGLGSSKSLSLINHSDLHSALWVLPGEMAGH